MGEPVFRLPFYYSSLETCWVFFKTTPKRVEILLKGKDLKPAVFEDGSAIVGLCFQQFSSHNATTVTELEYVVASYPKNYSPERELTAEQFIKGEDQEKILGLHRVEVLASNKYAVEAGRQLFGENKFLTTFDTTWPGLNEPDQRGWKFTVYDPKTAPDFIFKLEVSTGSIPAVDGNPQSHSMI